MSTAFQVTPKLSVFPRDAELWVTTANHKPADLRENALGARAEHSTPPINDVKSLQKGVIKPSENKAKAPYTILLVGETGVGKSSFLELIANVLAGNDIDHYNFNILDHANEQGGSNNQSQTNSTRLYKLMSNNGIAVHILDTPGLVDTRNIEQNQLYKKRFASQIQSYTDSVTAVLVLANGTVPRSTVGIDHVLSTFSTIFPKPLTNNTAFMFTNISNPLSWNFCEDTIPSVLERAPQFPVDNPVALQKKYLKIKDDPKMINMRAEMRREVEAAEQGALEMLVNLFDWLDGLEQQPTSEVVPHYEKFRNMVANLISPIAKQLQEFRRKVENKFQEGVQKVKRIFISK